jgi:cytochrome o ubiquinol oxidase subunit 3
MTEARHDTSSMIHLGFWIYLMTDCILFGVLFAAYVVLHNNTFGGPTSKDIIVPSHALAQTLILLTSSFCCGLVGMGAQENHKKRVLFWCAVTLALGIAFLVLQSFEFMTLCQQGVLWKQSGFLSAFFTLVGTHGIHLVAGVLWAIVMLFQISFKGLTPFTLRRLTSFRMFWHFLNIVWVFIFTIVYMMGAS